MQACLQAHETLAGIATVTLLASWAMIDAILALAGHSDSMLCDFVCCRRLSPRR